MKKIFTFVWKFKFLILIILVALGVGGYFGWKKFFPKTAATSYITAKVRRGDLVSSVSGAGQVYAATQLDIKPKVSGDVIAVNVKAGQEVKTGDLIARLDGTAAAKAVRDAQTALDSANLEMEDLLAPADELSQKQAENAVTIAQNNLDKFLSPPDQSDLRQAEDALLSAQNSLLKFKSSYEVNYQKAQEAQQKAGDNLKKAYEDAFNSISNAFLDLPTIMTGLNNVLYGYDIAKAEASVSYNWNINALKSVIPYADATNQLKFDELAKSAEDNYLVVKTAYDKNFESYKNTSRYSDKAVIEALLGEAVETVKSMAETAKSESNLLDFWVDYRTQRELRVFSKVTSYQTDLKTYTSKTSSQLSSLLSVQRSIEDAKDTKVNAARDIEEMERDYPMELYSTERAVQIKEEALADLKAGADATAIESARLSLEEKKLALQKLREGADELDIRIKKSAVEQKEGALADARQALADHSIVVPFDGIITEVNVQKGNSVSSGTVVASLITRQEVAQITLNEIDVVKVKLGQSVALTFDAIDGLTLTGEVAEIDAVGTVSQGVVSYNVKISFEDPEGQVKPGMSVSAEIIFDSRQNVLMVPAGAVQTVRDNSFVRILADGQPKMQAVTVGLSNDIMTEIVSGVNEGDVIITQTATASINSNGNTSQDRNQNFPMGGEMMRMIR